MRYYNADGKPGSLCGNGGRCIVAFAHALGLTNRKTSFWAADGQHRAEIIDSPQLQSSPLGASIYVSLAMNPVSYFQQVGPDAYITDTGSPHYIEFLPEEIDLDHYDVWRNGRAIRNSAAYKEKGINVNFVKWTGSGLQVRTYERGVEDETLSCGTGVTAAALVSHFSGRIPPQWASPLTLPIFTKGGMLQVTFLPPVPQDTADTLPSATASGAQPAENQSTSSSTPPYSDIWLSGPATRVFKAELCFPPSKS